MRQHGAALASRPNAGVLQRSAVNMRTRRQVGRAGDMTGFALDDLSRRGAAEGGQQHGSSGAPARLSLPPGLPNCVRAQWWTACSVAVIRTAMMLCALLLGSGVVRRTGVAFRRTQRRR